MSSPAKAVYRPTGPARLIAETEALIALKQALRDEKQHEAADIVECDLWAVMRRINVALGARGLCRCDGGAQ